MSKPVNKKEKKKTVLKPSATIQSTGKPTLLQRRCYNILIAEAHNDFGNKDKRIHQIKMSDLWDYLGVKGGRPDNHIKDMLKALVKMEVEWNILGKDTLNEWGVTCLLASCKIKDGICEYSFSEHLREKFYEPEMYAIISLSLQNRFDSKHTLTLYELALDYYIAKRGFGETPKVSLEEFRKIMGFSDNEYKEYKVLNRDVIKIAVKEINEKTDIFISVKTFKDGRKVNALKVHIKGEPAQITYKQLGNQTQLFSYDEKQQEEINKLKDIFSNWGVSDENFNRYLSQYGLEKLEDIQIEVEGRKNTIKNIPSWVYSALNDNYDLPKAQKEREKQGKIKKDLEIKKRKQEKEELAKEQEKVKQQQVDKWISENSMKYNWICLEFLEEAPKDSKIKFSYDYWTKNAKKENKDLLEYCKKNKTFLGFVRNKIYTDNIVDMNI